MLTKEEVLAAIRAEKNRVLTAMIVGRQRIADLTTQVEHSEPTDPKDPGSAVPLHSAAEVDAACGHFDAAALMLGEPVQTADAKEKKPKDKKDKEDKAKAEEAQA
jgi:hypothetical protein